MDTFNSIYQACVNHLIRYAGFEVLTVLVSLVLIWRKQAGAKWFFLMNFVWVSINTLIIIWLSKHIYLPSPDLSPLVSAHIQFMLRINLGLDFMYALIGLYLYWHSESLQVYKDMLRLFAWAVMFQGLGLLILDGLFFMQVLPFA